jgi:nitrogen fixation NifU-like protein
LTLIHDKLINEYKNPYHRGFAGLEGDESLVFDVSKANHTCGDKCDIKGRLDSGKKVEAYFEGHMCSVSQASASLLMKAVSGKSLDEISTYVNEILGFSGDGDNKIENIYVADYLTALKAFEKFPTRLNCLKLPWDCLKIALENLKK